jgi:hypothetical protein
MIKIILSFMTLIISTFSYSQILNCSMLDYSVNLKNFSSILGGFDLDGYSPDVGHKTPDAVAMKIEFYPSFEAKIILQGTLEGKKISEKKFLKAWWQRDRQETLVHYAPYSRSSVPAPNFIIKFVDHNQAVTLFYKAHGNYPPKKAMFNCR